MIKMLTVLVSTISNSMVFLLKSTISNSLVFLLKKNRNEKATQIFFQQKMLAYITILNDQSFNNTFTSDIVSFEQLGPGISVIIRPHYTLVHPKDKVEKENTCGVVYEIPCHNCELKRAENSTRVNIRKMPKKCTTSIYTRSE